MSRAALFAAALGLAAGCGVPLETPLGQAAINTCQTSSDCAAGATCTQGECVATSYDLDGLLLQVSPLAGATFGAGTSYLIDPGATFSLVSSKGASQASLPALTINLSAPVSVKGKVLLDPSTLLAAGCNFPDGLPAQLTFYRAPRFAGLPFDPVQVSTTATSSKSGNTYAYEVELVSDKTDLYDVYIEPLAVPSCPTVIPPYFLAGQTITNKSGVWQLPPVGTLSGTINGLTDPASWQIDVVDPSRGLPISAGSTLQYTIGSAGVTATAQIYSLPLDPSTWPILRLTPVDPTQPDPKPVDPTRPTIYWALEGSVIDGTQTNPKVEFNVEDLGVNPVDVQGQILSSDATTGIDARLSIQSVSLQGANAGNAAFSANAVQTQPQPTGTFTIGLPPGDYTVRIFPTVDGVLSITDGQINWPTNQSTPACVCGIPFELAPRVTLHSTATTPDGRLLGGVTVGITPSQAPARSYLAATHELGPLQPRVETTTTDGSGAFSLRADLGNVDLTVQPDPATNLPWLVIPRISPASVVVPSALALTSPVFLTGTLLDPQNNPVANAQVDAWYPVRSATVPGTVVKIATTSTDAAGAYTLVLPSSVSSSGLM